MNIIGKILPVDGYIVRLNHALPANFLQSLTHLYQPLIGPQAIMLYQTLVNEVQLQHKSEPQTHHTLMNYLMLPLDKIYSARLKLEAMGLMKTYQINNDEMTVYTYALEAPYEPKDFFNDAMYAPLLYHYIGEQKFNELKERFLTEDTHEVGEEITSAFEDVFHTTPFQKLPQAPKVEENERVEEVETVDFSWLEQSLKQRMIPVHRVLTKENRKLISQMLTLYDLESFEIDKALIFSINEENYLDQEEFKRSCHDIYRVKSNHQAVQLIPKTEKIENQQAIEKSQTPATKEEKLIQTLENITPKELLEDLSGGNYATDQDLKLISDVMTRQGLPSPVMNVLIHYVLLQTNNKLSRNYLEKIAGQWSRARLKTAREAIAFAKKERANYEEAKAKRNGRQKGQAKDIVPNWYKQGKHKEKPVKQNQTNMSEEQQQVAELLKQFSDGN